MCYRVFCETCQDFNDVPDLGTVAAWQAAHAKDNPTHRADAEPYPSITFPWGTP